MTSQLKRFIAVLTIGLAFIFILHLLFLHFNNLPLFDNKILLAYILNYTLALIVYLLLFSLRVKLKNQLGFLFMAGSFIKFVVFFLFFFSSYKADGDISRLEFGSFFIPYLICLIIETYSLVNLLKKLK